MSSKAKSALLIADEIIALESITDALFVESTPPHVADKLEEIQSFINDIVANGVARVERDK